jgi:hypothetical protein
MVDTARCLPWHTGSLDRCSRHNPHRIERWPANARRFISVGLDLHSCFTLLSQLLVSPSPPPRSMAEPAGDVSCLLDTIQQQMERRQGGVRRLAVKLRLDLAPEWLWSVLTDYANLHRFIPNLQSSRLLWRRGNRVALEQVGSQQFCGMRFTARVQLELLEDREQGSLNFNLIEGDFRCFQGAWRIGCDGISSWLLYELTVQGKPGMPIGLIEQRLQQDLASNLRGVQQEAQRRSALVA